jgi:hypothetical protein
MDLVLLGRANRSKFINFIKDCTELEVMHLVKLMFYFPNLIQKNVRTYMHKEGYESTMQSVLRMHVVR